MLKRTWLVVIGLLALGLALSACGNPKLAPELTPIPTLPPGEEPALVDALQQAPAAEAGEEAGTEMGDDPVEVGAVLFAQVCAACHADTDTVGPALPHIAAEAAATAEELGMTTEEYLHQSIVDPAAYVVEGFQPIMPPGYGDQYTEDELEALIAYILAQGEAEAPAEMDADEGAADTMSADEDAGDTMSADGDAAEAEAGEGTMVNEELVAQGEKLFAATCRACHMDADTIGPALPRIAETAAEIAEAQGMSVEEYLHQSIVDPAAYVVEGFNPIMPPGYGDQYTEDELEALIAYILAQGNATENGDN